MYFQSFYWIFNFLILLVISKNSFLFSRVPFFFFLIVHCFCFMALISSFISLRILMIIFGCFLYFFMFISLCFLYYCFLFQKIIFLFMLIPSFQFGVSIQISDDPFIFKGEAPKRCMQTRSAHGCDL